MRISRRALLKAGAAGAVFAPAVISSAAAALPLGSAGQVSALANLHLASRLTPLPEKAEFNFAWLTSPGFGVFMASIITMLLVRMNLRQVGLVVAQVGLVLRRVVHQVVRHELKVLAVADRAVRDAERADVEGSQGAGALANSGC